MSYGVFNKCDKCGEDEKCVEIVDGEEVRTCKNLCFVGVRRPFPVVDHKTNGIFRSRP